MMHGYGLGWNGGWMHDTGSLFWNGWMVITMMGIGFLFILGLIAWVLWTQRESLGFYGPNADEHQMATGHGGGTPMRSSPMETAEQVARRRYASGQIDSAEYGEIMETLGER